MDTNFSNTFEILRTAASFGKPVNRIPTGHRKIGQRVGLIWYSGYRPTLKGFHDPNRKLQFMHAAVRIFKGPQRGCRFESFVLPVLHWKRATWGLQARVCLWEANPESFKHLILHGREELLVGFRGKSKFTVRHIEDDPRLREVVSNFGDQVFDEAWELMRKYRKSGRVGQWKLREAPWPIDPV